MNKISDFLHHEGAQFLFDHLTVEIHVWEIVRDAAGEVEPCRLIYANPPALASWNIGSLDKITGRTTDEIFGPGSTEHYYPIVKKIMDENVPYTFRDYFEHLNKHFRFTSVPLGDYFITTGDDITEFVEEQESVVLLNRQLEDLVKQRTASLKDSEEEIRTLQGIIPICSYCHNIRNDEGAWDRLEAYISKHSDAKFSHGICPKCVQNFKQDTGLDTE